MQMVITRTSQPNNRAANKNAIENNEPQSDSCQIKYPKQSTCNLKAPNPTKQKTALGKLLQRSKAAKQRPNRSNEPKQGQAKGKHKLCTKQEQGIQHQ